MPGFSVLLALSASASFAPDDSSDIGIAAWPSRHAHISAVLPTESVVSTTARFAATSAARPRKAAACSGCNSLAAHAAAPDAGSDFSSTHMLPLSALPHGSSLAPWPPVMTMAESEKGQSVLNQCTRAPRCPLCTIKNFPFEIEHCIEWAREAFHSTFTGPAADCAAMLADALAFFARVAEEPSINSRRRMLEGIIEAARLQFENMFVSSVRQLLHKFPPANVDSKGNKFWSGTKRRT
jgi:hypothetical protein